MKENVILKKAINEEIESLIWAAKEYANETISKEEFKAQVWVDDEGIVEVAIMFDEGKDGHLYYFEEEEGRLSFEEGNYFDSNCTRKELEKFEEVEL